MANVMFVGNKDKYNYVTIQLDIINIMDGMLENLKISDHGLMISIKTNPNVKLGISE